MPLRTSRSEKREVEAARRALDPSAVFECWEPHAVQLPGGAIVIPAGERRRGDDPAVITSPGLIVRDGAGADERYAARRAAFPATTGYGVDR